MDIVVDILSGLLGLVRNMLIFFAIAIAISVAFYLYRSWCPACHKLRAAKHVKTKHEGRFFFTKSTETLRCKFCSHTWSRDVSD